MGHSLIRSTALWLMLGEQMDAGKRNASQTKKKCGSLHLETVAVGSTRESEDRVQMKQIH